MANISELSKVAFCPLQTGEINEYCKLSGVLLWDFVNDALEDKLTSRKFERHREALYARRDAMEVVRGERTTPIKRTDRTSPSGLRLVWDKDLGGPPDDAPVTPPNKPTLAPSKRGKTPSKPPSRKRTGKEAK
jgi:hypothetical protein